MKKVHLFSIFLISIIASSMMVSGQVQSNPVSFDLSEDHELTAFAEGSLTWSDGDQEQLVLNLTMSDFRVNNSEIDIFRVVFALYDSTTGSPSPNTVSNSSQITLTTSFRSVEYSPIFNVPDEFDRFYINITMLVAPEGGGVDDSRQSVSLRFPQDSTIIVQRDNIVPVVNLYGFPSGEFFQFWLPIYSVFLIFLLSPALIVGVSKIQEMRKKSEGATDNDAETEDGSVSEQEENKSEQMEENA